MIFGYKPNINYLPNIIWLNRIFNYSVATLLKSKDKLHIYMTYGCVTIYDSVRICKNMS